MSYSIKRQETTGLWIIVDDSTGKTVSRAELPSDAVNLAKEKGIPASDLTGIVDSAQSQDAAENDAIAQRQAAANAEQSQPGTNAGTGGTPYKESVAFQQSPSGSMAGETGYNTDVNDGQAGPPGNSDFTKYQGSSNQTGNESFSDPRNARLANAGLYKGGANSTRGPATVPWVLPGASDTGGVPTEKDWRVRISLPPGSEILYNNQNVEMGFMEPLISSGVFGVVFPYTPNITMSYNARYQEQSLTHSNFKSYFYEGSDVAPITISGEFTAQNQGEAQYVLACVYFLRACTKMLWGQDVGAGTPPPIVKLNGYGYEYFPDVSCIITNFQHTMPGDVDYIAIQKEYYDNTRVPVISTISVTLQPVYSRKKQHDDFTVASYGPFGGTSKGKGFL
jgi:hypothetical protein